MTAYSETDPLSVPGEFCGGWYSAGLRETAKAGPAYAMNPLRRAGGMTGAEEKGGHIRPPGFGGRVCRARSPGIEGAG